MLIENFYILEIIENCNQSIECYIDFEQNLEIDYNEPENETIVYEESSESEEEGTEEQTADSSVSKSIPSSPVKRPKRHISIEDKKRAVDYWKSGKTKNLTLATVSKRFRFVYSIQQLKNFEKQIENYGSREEKIKDIWNYTFNEFIKAKNNCLTVHDNDLKRWALKRNMEITLPNFTASHSWLWRFKTQNRIVSRKITKFVTRNYSKERMDFIKTANLFVDSTKHFI